MATTGYQNYQSEPIKMITLSNVTNSNSRRNSHRYNQNQHQPSTHHPASRSGSSMYGDSGGKSLKDNCSITLENNHLNHFVNFGVENLDNIHPCSFTATFCCSNNFSWTHNYYNSSLPSFCAALHLFSCGAKKLFQVLCLECFLDINYYACSYCCRIICVIIFKILTW